MQVEVFKTNVDSKKEAKMILEEIEASFPGAKVNFDLDDKDKILRIQSPSVSIEEIKNCLEGKGYYCELLPD